MKTQFRERMTGRRDKIESEDRKIKNLTTFTLFVFKGENIPSARNSPNNPGSTCFSLVHLAREEGPDIP